MPQSNVDTAEIRREDRDEVHYRTRAVHADGRILPLLVVNISPHGLMARCEVSILEGDTLRVTLPGVGQLPTRLRWVLGGRIGCQFERPIALARYHDLLTALR